MTYKNNMIFIFLENRLVHSISVWKIDQVYFETFPYFLITSNNSSIVTCVYSYKTRNQKDLLYVLKII